jgi:hypothetical protein
VACSRGKPGWGNARMAYGGTMSMTVEFSAIPQKCELH